MDEIPSDILYQLIKERCEKELFDLNFYPLKLDDLSKPELARLVLELWSRIKKLRDPKFKIKSKVLIDLYLKKYKFPKNQKSILLHLADRHPHKISYLYKQVYKKKLHKSINKDSAIRKLISDTRKTIKETDHQYTFQIKRINKDSYKLVISQTYLQVRLTELRNRS